MRHGRNWIFITLVVLVWTAGWDASSVSGYSEAAVGRADSGQAQSPEVRMQSPVTAEANALKLEQQAETLYGYVTEGNINKARETTDAISRLFVLSSFDGLTSVEGVNALSGAIIDMKAAVAGVSVQQERWETAAARLRLAANSLAHPRQPMWLQYYKLIREDLNDMEQSAAGSDLTGWKTAVSHIEERYDTIRPAIIIARKPEEVNRFDAWLSYAAGLVSGSRPPGREELMNAVSQGREAARVMFGKERDEPALSLPLAPREYGLAGWLGAGFILAALAYTAYRKYRGERSRWQLF
ncbi:sporulation protein YpjB [Paenibacillus sophorae]|uniref:Sporulation protein YpjB n=1 Tax=Paenibacillus sophorae TaxID=1333845 RepID=A0A1H8NI30_9BACL|nr:sporulation protein YpjB [Paenibacillus sophorae]QWU14613.1 sporulation protein YpjB [Paenibacillus sophorae]SEO29139.1 sporulation protein YpjB [Paenibacillus sophorae]